MSLLDTGDTAVVFPEVQTVDSRGDVQTGPAVTGVEVRQVRMQPMSTGRQLPSLDTTQQQRVRATWRFFARTAPLGTWAKVEWRGVTFSVQSGPEERYYSSATSHVTAVLQEER